MRSRARFAVFYILHPSERGEENKCFAIPPPPPNQGVLTLVPPQSRGVLRLVPIVHCENDDDGERNCPL